VIESNIALVRSQKGEEGRREGGREGGREEGAIQEQTKEEVNGRELVVYLRKVREKKKKKIPSL